ncbi:hypothetical protein ACOMHN_029102 [Nucella lapillus]
MVAECCRLGFSSHQPPLTGDHESLLQGIIDTVVKIWINLDPPGFFDCPYMRHSVLTSPLVCAVLRDLPVVILMLFESAFSSRTDQSTLSTQLLKLTDLDTQEGMMLNNESLKETEEELVDMDDLQQRYNRLTDILEKNAAFMGQLATTPHSLLSSCRLLILRHFHFSNKKRQVYIQRLSLPVPLKNYLEFSDFCHPDYGQQVTLPPPSLQDDDSLSEERSSDDTDDDDFSSEEMSSGNTDDDEY